MNDFFKRVSSAGLGALAGAGLAAASLVVIEALMPKPAFARCGADAINLTGTSNFCIPLYGRSIKDACWEEWSKVFKKASATGGPWPKYSMRDSAHFCIERNGGRISM